MTTVSPLTWNAHFAKVGDIIKECKDTWSPTGWRNATVAMFFDPQIVNTFVNEANSKKVFDILTEAHNRGFLLDVVVDNESHNKSQATLHQRSRETPRVDDTEISRQMQTSEENPNFIADYLAQSRLHHLSTWKSQLISEIKDNINTQQKVVGAGELKLNSQCLILRRFIWESENHCSCGHGCFFCDREFVVEA